MKNNKKKHEMVLKGIYMSSQKSFGFCRLETEQENEKLNNFVQSLGKNKDIYIGRDDTKNALDKDLVLVKIKKFSNSDNKHCEGEVIDIIKHNNNRIVGRYIKSGKFGFVSPDNKRIKRDVHIKAEYDLHASTGDKVVVDVYDFGNDSKKPEGKIVEIIGKIGEKGVDITSIVKDYNIRDEFNDDIKQELLEIPDEVVDFDNTRSDFRNKLTFTIDGKDARDLDDAISVYVDNNLYEIGVHIADVSYYVKENSALDKEAKLRGTSVYFPDRVIPMLPQKLSNGICSLNAGVDRLSLSCVLYFNKNGEFETYKIVKSIINVNHRLNYTDTATMLGEVAEDTPCNYKNDNNLIDALVLLRFICKQLRNERKKRGSIDFNFPESKIILDENGVCIDVKPYERNVATKIIEDLMLKANEVVAEHYYFLEYPFLYRVHENPDPEKIKYLTKFIEKIGFTMKQKSGEAHPKEVQKLLAKIENHPLEMMINRVALRSMKKARYSSNCLGHFGLAAKYYTHFTSPIRRYPDLQIHRIINMDLNNELDEKMTSHFRSIMDDVAFITSQAEEKAEKAENDSIKMKKCEFMQKKIGEVFCGVISDVSDYGIYVELDNLVEGFIHVRNMNDDHYIFDKDNYELYGRSNHKVYKVGDKIKIKVSGVDKLMRTIDFELAKKDD